MATLNISKLMIRTGITDRQLELEVEEKYLYRLAGLFGNWEKYIGNPGLNLQRGEKEDVRFRVLRDGNVSGVIKALTIWVNSNLNVTYRDLVKISLELKEYTLAVDICRTVVKCYTVDEPGQSPFTTATTPQGAAVGVPLTNSGTAVIGPHDVLAKIRHFDKQFQDLSTSMLRELTENVSLSDFKNRLVTLPFDISNEHEKFLTTKFSVFEEASSFRGIFVHFNSYLSFIDFSLLEHIIKHFGSHGLQQRMDCYARDMKLFRMNTIISDVIPHLPQKSDCPQGYSKLELKSNIDITKSTLEDLDQYRKRFASEFLLSEFALLLSNIKQSSLLVVWLIPSAVIPILKEHIKEKDLSLFLVLKILKLSLDEECLYPFPTWRASYAKKNEGAMLTSQVATLTTQIGQERANIPSSLSANLAGLAAENVSIEEKEDTIQSLDSQLTKTRDYLTSEPQPLQVQLSYSQCSEAPMKMGSGKAILISSDKVYYGGGSGDVADDKHYVHCFTPSQDVWSTLPRLPVRYFGLGKVNGELVTVGGDKQQDYDYSKTNEIHVFDESSQNWKQPIPPMPTARNSAAVISCQTHLVVAGGSLSSRNPTDIVEIYNSDTSQWSKTDRLPYRCDDSSGTVINNTLYLMGGWDYKNFFNKVVTAQLDKLISNSVPVDQLNDDRNPNNASDCDSAWKEIAHTPAYTPSTVAMSDMVLAVGGRESQNKYNYTATLGIYAYSSSMHSWLCIGDLPSPTWYPATVSLSPTELLVIGGRNINWDKVSTVHKVTILPL